MHTFLFSFTFLQYFNPFHFRFSRITAKKILQDLKKEIRDKYLAALTPLTVEETDLLMWMSKVTLPLNFREMSPWLCDSKHAHISVIITFHTKNITYKPTHLIRLKIPSSL